MAQNLSHRTGALRLGLVLVLGLQVPHSGHSAERAGKVAPESDDYLIPHFRSGQIFSNVFSILNSRKTEGYDERAGRNGGSADYVVVSASPAAWRFNAVGRYDGRPLGHHYEVEMRDGGSTSCLVGSGDKDKCEPYLDASGLTYNPALWGTPPKRLSAGMSWKVDIQPAWELGGKSGTETVTVVRVDPLTNSATLMREGTAEGFFDGESNTVELSHNGQTESFDVTPGTSHWKGYTTFVNGVVFSDELLVTRSDVLHGKDGKTLNSDTRRIMLLNASPFPTLS
jgi:hypothetical protein